MTAENKSIIIGTDQNLDYLSILKHKQTEGFFEQNILSDLIPTTTIPTDKVCNSQQRKR